MPFELRFAQGVSDIYASCTALMSSSTPPSAWSSKAPLAAGAREQSGSSSAWNAWHRACPPCRAVPNEHPARRCWPPSLQTSTVPGRVWGSCKGETTPVSAGKMVFVSFVAPDGVGSYSGCCSAVAVAEWDDAQINFPLRSTDTLVLAALEAV